MKKLLFLFSIMLFQTFAFGQVHEISFGIAPSGHWRLKETKGQGYLLSHSYSISRPAFHLNYVFRNDNETNYNLGNEYLGDIFYAKESLFDQSGQFCMENNHFALHFYRGYTFLYLRRVQFPCYLGGGLSYYSQPVPTKLHIEIGGRVRMRVYVTNTIALYVGGYYLLGLNGDKSNKAVVHHSGLETGLLFNFE